MHRVVEPELMDDDTQAEAYATTDFEEAHSRIVSAFADHAQVIPRRRLPFGMTG